MKPQKLKYYFAHLFAVNYWSYADHFALPLFGFFIFAYLTYLGVKITLMPMALLALPFALVCLVMLTVDEYCFVKDRDNPID